MPYDNFKKYVKLTQKVFFSKMKTTSNIFILLLLRCLHLRKENLLIDIDVQLL